MGGTAWMLALLATPSLAQEGRSLRIATEGAYPPFNVVDATGEVQGFEIDLARAFCAAIKARCTFVIQQWDGITRGLLDREVDAIVASLHVTERRRRQIAFSRPYYRIPSTVIARKDSSLTGVTAEALAGLSIGTVERSEVTSYLEARYATSDVKLYGKLEEASLDLLTERLDVVAGDKLVLSRFLASREGACCRIIGDLPADPAYFNPGAAIGLRQDETALRAAFDAAIAQVIKDGTYDRIREKYFAFDVKPPG
jgi:polar amino acid transport system substrate-binding protein